MSSEPSEPRSNPASYVLLSQTFQNCLAAMHYCFRALHQQCLLTSVACRYKWNKPKFSSQAVSIGTRYSSLLPLAISTPDQSTGVSKSFYTRCQQPWHHSVSDISLDRGAQYFNHSYINKEERDKLNLLCARYQSEMPKRKESHSEHSNSHSKKRSHSDRSKSHSKKRSHSTDHSKSRTKKHGSTSKKHKGAVFDDESKTVVAKLRRSMRRQSKEAARDHDVGLVSPTKSRKAGKSDKNVQDERSSRPPKKAYPHPPGRPDIEIIKVSTTSSSTRCISRRSKEAASDHNVESDRSTESRKAGKSGENVQDKHSSRPSKKMYPHPPGWDDIEIIKVSTTTSSSTRNRKSLTPPPAQCGFTQRDFLMYNPDLYQKQSRRSTPPPGWGTFAKRGFSTTSSLPEKKHDEPYGQLSNKDLSTGDKYQRSNEATNYEYTETNLQASQGSRRRQPFEFHRHWKDTSLGKRHRTKPHTGEDFSVMCYNVLAQQLLHMNDHLYQHSYGNVLHWEYRKQNLLLEMADINSDILCLQEVQGTHFTSFYEPEMKKLGYRGVFKQRTGDKHDGCATFYKESRFDLVDYKLLEYRRRNVPLLDRDNVAVIVLLQPKGVCRSERICISNTHLLYNPKRGDIKLTQLGLLLAEIDKLSYNPSPGGTNSPRHHSVIMCGDFNSVPQCSLVEFIQRGRLEYEGLRAVDVSGQEPWKNSRYLSSPLWPGGVGVTGGCQYASVLQQRQSGTNNNSSSQSETNLPSNQQQASTKDTNCNISGNLGHPFQFNSSYVYNEDSKEVTTFHGRTNCMVDYIFYSSEMVCHRENDTKQLRLLSRLSLFTEEEAIEMGELPNAKWSSDHFSLAAKFLLLPSDDVAKKK